jgi:hypothetical protein
MSTAALCFALRMERIRLGVSKTRRLILQSEGGVMRKPCERLSGHGSSPIGEESEALNRAAFDSQGQKRRAFELFRLSFSNGFLNTQPDPFYIDKYLAQLK